jgi:hypothetical protein
MAAADFSTAAMLSLGISAFLSDVVNGVADGLDFLVVVIRNRDSELIFKFHDQLDHVEGIGFQVVDEVRGAADFLLRNAQLLADNSDHFYFIGHNNSSGGFEVCFKPGFPRGGGRLETGMVEESSISSDLNLFRQRLLSRFMPRLQIGPHEFR